MVNFESVTVSALRGTLVNNGLMTEDEANSIKGKSNLVHEVKKGMASGTITDTSLLEPTQEDEDAIEIPLELEAVEDEVGETIPSLYEELAAEINGEEVTATTKPIAKSKIPKIYTVEWQDYVLKQFTEDELLDIGKSKYPTVVGLRRVVELLLGEITFSGPTQNFPSLDGNQIGRASVLYEVQIAWRADSIEGYVDLNGGLPIRTFCATAEAWSESIKDDRFKPFPLTIAETRAEGRALRKALFLKTQSAEELLGSEMPTRETVSVVQEFDENAKISDQQVSVIRSKCSQLNIDVDKFAPDVENLKKVDGVELIKTINKYQQGESNVPKELLKE